MARDDPGSAGADAGGEPMRPRRSLRYNVQRRATFVRVLAESYDIEAALLAAELTWHEVTELRVRHPDFAARIDEVIVAGFDRLEAAFLRVATAALAAEKPDLNLVQAVLKLRRPARAVAAPARPSAKEEAARKGRIETILNKLAQLHAARPGGGGDGRDEADPGAPHRTGSE